jgi:hypothetical protein
MNYPLSKDKQGGFKDYLYRGVKVKVSRTYSFNADYVVQSYYEVAEMAIFATSPKELKKRVDRKLASTTEETS